MKKDILLLLSVVTSLMVGIVACDKPVIDEVNPDDDDTIETPVDSVAVIDTTDTGIPMYNFPAVSTVPLEVGNLLAEGSDIGVTIEVTKVEHQNFVFELRPGAQIQSFRFDVFPLSQLYNALLNDQMVGKDAVDINEKIRDYIFAEDGSGGFQISVKDFPSEEDFLQIEYDWMNTTYAAATAIAIPDCDYVIGVVACTGDDCSASTQGELTLCYVHTTSDALIGDPQVDIEVNTGYKAFSVNHIPNADAAGVYFFGWLTQEIDAYIDVFGNRLFRDFMRTRVSSPSAASEPDALVYSVNYGEAADHRIQSTTCAVAVDENLTPATNFSRVDFHLKEIPQEQPTALVSVDIIDERVASAYFEFKIDFSADCQTFFMKVVSEEQKQSLESASADVREAKATELMNDGWGCHNPTLRWDEDNVAQFEKASHTDCYYAGMQPGETYYMCYIGRNRYMTLTDLYFSEPIKVDARNLESPDDCKVKDLKLTITDVKRTSYKINIEYDPSTVSMVYCSYFFEGAEGFTLTTEDSWKDWAGYIFAPSLSGTGSMEYSSMNVNAWPTQSGGYDYWGVTGMLPGTEYTVFVCAEDFDGNISQMQFATITTTIPTPGPEPTMELTLSKSKDTSMGEWTVTYRMVKDVKEFYYCLVDVDALKPYLSEFNKYKYENIANYYSYQEWYDAIYEYVSSPITGNEDNGGGMHTDSEETYQQFKGSGQQICACVAVGEKDGTPVHELFTLVCKNGKAQTLEEIFNVTD